MFVLFIVVRTPESIDRSLVASIEPFEENVRVVVCVGARCATMISISIGNDRGCIKTWNSHA